MKKFLLALLVMSPLVALQWMDNYQQAAAKAKSENKPMVLFFQGSDWCGPCKALKQNILSKSDFDQKVGNKFIWVQVDFPQGKKLAPDVAKQNDDLKRKYGVSGLPTLIVLNPQGQEIGRMSGGSQDTPSVYADRLERMRSRNMSQAEELKEEVSEAAEEPSEQVAQEEDDSQQELAQAEAEEEVSL